MARLSYHQPRNGFTLIEVLLALAIVAIAFAALYKSMSSSIIHTQRLKEKTFQHWVGMQGITMIQLGLINLSPQPIVTKKTRMFNRTWYWQITHQPLPIAPSTERLTITVSTRPTGPFTDPLYAVYTHHATQPSH